jgi:hypothetical protein
MVLSSLTSPKKVPTSCSSASRPTSRVDSVGRSVFGTGCGSPLGHDAGTNPVLEAVPPYGVEYFAQVVDALEYVLAAQREIGGDEGYSSSLTSVGYGFRFGMPTCYRSSHTTFITPSSGRARLGVTTSEATFTITWGPS